MDKSLKQIRDFGMFVVIFVFSFFLAYLADLLVGTTTWYCNTFVDSYVARRECADLSKTYFVVLVTIAIPIAILATVGLNKIVFKSTKIKHVCMSACIVAILLLLGILLLDI